MIGPPKLPINSRPARLIVARSTLVVSNLHSGAPGAAWSEAKPLNVGPRDSDPAQCCLLSWQGLSRISLWLFAFSSSGPTLSALGILLALGKVVWSFTCLNVVGRELIIRCRSRVGRRPNHTEHSAGVPPRSRNNLGSRSGFDDVAISETNELLIRIGGVAQVNTEAPAFVQFRTAFLWTVKVDPLSKFHAPLLDFSAVQLLIRRLARVIDRVLCEKFSRVFHKPLENCRL